jgi:hypothetical protein
MPDAKMIPARLRSRKHVLVLVDPAEGLGAEHQA